VSHADGLADSSSCRQRRVLPRLGGVSRAELIETARLTQRLSDRDPFRIVQVKTGVAGAVNAAIALDLGQRWPSLATLLVVVAVGGAAYGASVVLDAYARPPSCDRQPPPSPARARRERRGPSGNGWSALRDPLHRHRRRPGRSRCPRSRCRFGRGEPVVAPEVPCD
jgi:hypothetical protein